MSKLRKVFILFVVMLAFAGFVQAEDVTFQVYMGVQEYLGTFDPEAGDIVVVRGTFNGWGGNDHQVTAVNDTLYTLTTAIDPGEHMFKFVIVQAAGGDIWEGVPDRPFTVVEGENLVLDPVWFDDNDSYAQLTDLEILFQVNMEIQILNGNFDPNTDWVVVRGNHGSIGNWGGAVQLYNETGTDNYSAWIQFDQVEVGGTLEYKFVILHDGNPDDPEPMWEQVDNRTYTITGEEPDTDDNGYGEYMPDLVYFGDTTPDDILLQDIEITFQVDLRTAYYHLMDSIIVDIQTQTDTVRQVDDMGIAGDFNGWPWGNMPAEFIFEDNDGDSIWVGSYTRAAGQDRNFIYKYGINQLDVEAGFAENHVVLLPNEETTTIVDTFGTNGTMYDPYLYLLRNGEWSVDEGTELPTQFFVAQNYPNPFNPSTKISFNLMKNSNVMVKVFNINGQEVYSFAPGTMNAGQHSITFDASQLSSGTYIYTVQAGTNYVAKKMTLLK